MKKKLLKTILPLLAAIFLTGCLTDSKSGKSDHIPTEGVFETGIASWYGAEYHGRTTASGETFDRNAMTAAHKTLDFGTWVEVTNLENGRKVRVKINDRGPFVSGRIIDLSERAADEMGMKTQGLAQVNLKIVQGP